MSGTCGSSMRTLTSRAVMNVSMKLRSTSRARGRVWDGSMGSHQDSTNASSDTGRQSAERPVNDVSLDGAYLHGLLQRRQRVTRRHELMGHESRKPRLDDRARDGVPIQLLRVVQLVASGDAAGMEVADVTRVVANRANHVAFHDLHVIDVIEQLHARRPDGLDDVGAERRVVTLIVLVIDFAVEQLHANRHAVTLGGRGDAAQARDARLRRLRV